MPPGEKPPGPFRAEELLTDKNREELTAEELRRARVIDLGDLVEDTCLVHSALGHQQMEVRVEVDAVAECLNGGHHSGHELAPGCHLEVSSQRTEGLDPVF